MLRRVVSRVHWLLGITAGMLVVLTSITGAILAFEPGIIETLNPAPRVLARSVARLSPPQLIAAFRPPSAAEDVTGLGYSSDPQESPFATTQRRGEGGEQRYPLDPYTGVILKLPRSDSAPARGTVFFTETLKLHRWVMAGSFGDRLKGRQIVAAATVGSILIMLTGLYLHWPDRPTGWRHWLVLDRTLSGRRWISNLHTVLGIWIIAIFLVVALTGIHWSYPAYQRSLYVLTGLRAPMLQGLTMARTPIDSRGGADSRVDIAALWLAFQRETRTTGYTDTLLRFPQVAGAPATWTYFTAESPRTESGLSVLVADPRDGRVLLHESYAARSRGARIQARLFPDLHTGRLFGLPGILAYALACLAVPVLFVTGWMLYLGRRRRTRSMPG